jgi:hypothetical protein
MCTNLKTNIMRHLKLHFKTIIRFTLSMFIMLFGMNSLMASEYCNPKESGELSIYLLEKMDPEFNFSGIDGDKKKKKGDPFAKKNKKRKPNIYSSRPPRTKSRSKLYMHAMSKKKVRKTNQSTFSYNKSRYNLFKGQKKTNNKNRKENNGRKNSKPIL